ncbi:hypothetical protein DsansV1_C08g0083221 [Dioscorea sansibarensis]
MRSKDLAVTRRHVGIKDVVTSYGCFMDELIDSATDLHLLGSKKIITMAIGSDKAAAELLNGLTKEVIHDPAGDIGAVRKKVKHYSTHKWNRWRANLMHLYLDTPWKTLGPIAAVVLLVFTIVQTFYLVFSYHHPLKN